MQGRCFTKCVFVSGSLVVSCAGDWSGVAEVDFWVVSEDFLFLFFTTSVHPSCLSSSSGIDAPFGFSIGSFGGSSTFFCWGGAVPGNVSELFAKPAVRLLALNVHHHLPTIVNYVVKDFLELLPLQADEKGVVTVFYANAVFDGVDIFYPPVWGEERTNT